MSVKFILSNFEVSLLIFLLGSSIGYSVVSKSPNVVVLGDYKSLSVLLCPAVFML
jgi:hypothetical protein